MIKKILLLSLAFIALGTKAQVKPTIIWVNNVSQEPTISGISTSIDGNSNVYTAGRIYYSPSNADIIVRSMDSTGAILWTYTYDNGGYDSPKKVKVVNGFTYVTGVSYGNPSTGNDYVTICIDNSGNAVWVNRFDRGVNSSDEANDLSIDNGGDVYVTGKSRNSAGNDDATTIKINGSSGVQMWQHNFNPNGLNDEGICMTLANNQGDVIIGSNSGSASSGLDIVAYRLSSGSGNIGWITTINGLNNATDKCNAIILAGGNIVLCGFVDNGGGRGNDYVITKLGGTTGSSIFQKQYDFSSNDNATSLVRDSTGNIAATGIAYNSTTSLYEYHTLCYDSLGVSKWTHKALVNINSINVNPSIVCDTIAHHFYIAGEKQNTTRDVYTYQLTPGGNVGWEKTYNSPYTGSIDGATSLVVNGIGVIFVSACTTNSGGLFDISTIKIAQTPVYFAPDYGTPELNDKNFLFQQNLGQLLDPLGNPISSSNVGYYNQGVSPSYYFNNAKISHIISDKDTILDSLVRVDLNILGANAFADIFPYNPVDVRNHYFTQSALGITDVRSYNRLFIPEVLPNVDLQHYSNSRGLKSYFVFKTPGESLKSLRLQVDGAATTTVDSQGYLIASTPLGRINMGKLTAYQAIYNIANGTYSLSPVSASWNSLGSNMYNFNVSGYVAFWPVVVYISKPGATSATAAGPVGNADWSTYIGGQGQDYINRTRIDAQDNLYVGGSSSAISYPIIPGSFFTTPANLPATTNIQYGVLSKFRNDGKMIYSTFYGGYSSFCGYPQTQIWDIAVDSLYNIYMVGVTTAFNLVTKTITVSGALNITTNASSGSGGGCSNAFFAKINPAGNFLRFASYYGGIAAEKFNAASYAKGQVYMAGYSSSPTLSLVSPQPNTYQITTGAGMYMHIDTSGAVKHSTKLQQNIIDGAVDKKGNFYMVSSVYPTVGGGSLPVRKPSSSFYGFAGAGGWDWGIQRFSPADSLTWSTNFGGTGNDFMGALCIRDSVLAICGYGTSNDFPFTKSATDSGDVAHNYDYDAQLAKFNIKTGQIIWCAYHATGNIDRPYGIALDKDFNLYVAGTVDCPTTNTVTPSCSANGFKTLPAANYYLQNFKIDVDGFVVGYNNKNQRHWTTYFGSQFATTGQPNYDAVYGMAANNKDSKIFIGGYSTCPNNSLPLARWNSNCYYDSTYAGAGDGFITMFDVTNFILVGIAENGAIAKSNDLLLYPNPNSGIFNVKFTEKPRNTIKMDVFNAMGQIVFQKNDLVVEGADLSLDLSFLTKGVYLIHISDGVGIRTIKMVKD